jgi:glycosyltransferase involved in cell wall biosynthesis
MISTRDREASLFRSLARVVGQRGIDLEVLVIDDGSEPALCGERVAEVVGDGPCLRLLRNEASMGYVAARNRGIVAARHEVVIQLDDDSWPVEPDAFARVVDFMSEHPRVSALAVRLHYPWSDGVDGVGSVVPRWDRPHLAEDYTFQGCSVALRKNATVSAGLYPICLTYGAEETFLAAQLLARGEEIRVYSERRFVHGFDEPGGSPDERWRLRYTAQKPVRSTAGMAAFLYWSLPTPWNAILAVAHLVAHGARVPSQVPSVLREFRRISPCIGRRRTRRLGREAFARWLSLRRQVAREARVREG